MPPGLIVDDAAPASARLSVTVALEGAALPAAPGPDFPVVGGNNKPEQVANLYGRPLAIRSVAFFL